jgi:hypothetical protein
MGETHLTELDIVEATLGRATGELSERVAASTDNDVASRRALWNHVAGSIESERAAVRESHARSNARILAQIQRPVENPAATQTVIRVSRPARVLVPALAAAGVVLAFTALLAQFYTRGAAITDGGQTAAAQPAPRTQLAAAQPVVEQAPVVQPLAAMQGRFVVTLAANGAVQVAPEKGSGAVRISGPVTLRRSDGRLQFRGTEQR